MKVPEPLFIIINPMMKLLLNSPLHALMSHSVLVLYFTGTKSGRKLSTPLRYHKDGETIRCFTSGSTLWWRNFHEPAKVFLQLRGSRLSYTGQLVTADAEHKQQLLVNYLSEYPADAAYHDVSQQAGQLNPEDLKRAVGESQIVEFSPL